MTAVYDMPTQYALPAGGAQIPIYATKFARRVEISEDESGPPVGILVTYPNGVTVQYNEPDYPVVLGDKVLLAYGAGNMLGFPAQTGHNARAADVYCAVASVAGDTLINVFEYA